MNSFLSLHKRLTRRLRTVGPAAGSWLVNAPRVRGKSFDSLQLSSKNR